MNIHEYQAKGLLQQFNIPVPQGIAVASAAEIQTAVGQFRQFPVAVKAQIHAGGRGKGGGVKLADDASALQALAADMLQMTLVTQQTGPAGKAVHTVLLEEGVLLEKEFYTGIVLDRTTASIIIMVSTEGGVDIEEVAQNAPEKIVRVCINPLIGIQPYHCRQLAFGLKLDADLVQSFSSLIMNLYSLFVAKDCSLVEINPLVLTADRKLIALDAKITFDDNALYRHQDILALYDPLEDDALEVEAAQFGLNYIKLDGNVGNMVNGAGLAMATMDIIKMAGAEPANFLDVGGGASSEMVENGFRIILSDPNVKAILVNIFGGILRCDVLAKGIVQAAKSTGITVPVVVRMEGTNVTEGRRILAESGLNLITAANLKEAAQKVANAIAI